MPPMFAQRLAGQANAQQYRVGAEYGAGESAIAPHFNKVNPLLDPGALARQSQMVGRDTMLHHNMVIQDEEMAQRVADSAMRRDTAQAAIQNQKYEQERQRVQDRANMGHWVGEEGQPAIAAPGGPQATAPQPAQPPQPAITNNAPQQVAMQGPNMVGRARTVAVADYAEPQGPAITQAMLQSTGKSLDDVNYERSRMGLPALTMRKEAAPQPAISPTAQPRTIGPARGSREDRELGIREAESGTRAAKALGDVEKGKEQVAAGQAKLAEQMREFDAKQAGKSDTEKQKANKDIIGAQKATMTPESYTAALAANDPKLLVPATRMTDAELATRMPAFNHWGAESFYGNPLSQTTTSKEGREVTSLTDEGETFKGIISAIHAESPAMNHGQLVARAMAQMGYQSYADPQAKAKLQQDKTAAEVALKDPALTSEQKKKQEVIIERTKNGLEQARKVDARIRGVLKDYALTEQGKAHLGGATIEDAIRLKMQKGFTMDETLTSLKEKGLVSQSAE